MCLGLLVLDSHMVQSFLSIEKWELNLHLLAGQWAGPERTWWDLSASLVSWFSWELGMHKLREQMLEKAMGTEIRNQFPLPKFSSTRETLFM